MDKPFVYVTRKLPEEQLSALKEEARIEMWGKGRRTVPARRSGGKSKKAHGLLTMLSDTVDEELLKGAPHLKVVANLAVGYDNLDVEAAKKHGVICCNTPGVLTESTADLTFALLMASARRIVEASDWIRQGNWTGWGRCFWPERISIIKRLASSGWGALDKPSPGGRKALAWRFYIITAPAIPRRKPNWAHPIYPLANCSNRRILWYA